MRHPLPLLFVSPVLFVSLVLGLAPGAAGQSTPVDQDWITLFDGESLDGWVANENPGSFSVQDGVIVVKGPRSHLFYTGPDGGAQFKNFVFEAEVMTRPSANSGVFIHTAFQDSGWPAQGYEVQVNTSHGDTIKTGSLYGVVKVNPAPSTDDQWFRLRIEVRGRRIVTSVDGVVAVDHVEPADVQGTRRLSRGTLALQAHDPGSEVHYRNLRLRPLSDELAMSRADWVASRSGEWWDRMDYGPFLSSVVRVAEDDVIEKGVSIELGPERRASVSYDTNTLRMAAGWPGDLRRQGTPFDGRHGTFPEIGATPTFRVAAGPGWKHEGSWEDPRAIPHGPIPAEHADFEGLHRHGERVVLEATVQGRQVRESPWLRDVDGIEAITREFELGPGPALTMAVADEPGRGLKLLDGGRAAFSAARLSIPDDRDRKVVMVDRSTQGFDALSMGGPTDTDLADRASNPDCKVSWVGAAGNPHPRSGVVEGRLPRIHDGQGPRNHDDTRRNVWFDGSRARLVMDLGRPVELARINTFSWHRTNRSPQQYRLYGHAGEAPDAAAERLRDAGWTMLAEVDSSGLGGGGQHGSSVSNRAGLGQFRHLMWVLSPSSNGEGCFLSEIDVHAQGAELADLRPPMVSGEARSLSVALLGAPDDLRLSVEGERLCLSIPAREQALRFGLAYTRELEADAAAAWGRSSPAPASLDAFCHGGPSLWPEEVVVEGRRDDGDASYVVDDIPVPADNPWACQMRLGGFDFFADGDRAALCTWNGDVWIVSGLNGDWKELRWRRFAGGLFETLGLCIVDDQVLVNGRDQITRLHDRDGDGEADFYESFNNDVTTTRNFHEFTFDLQRDAAGNFYFSKGGPVRPGGRGFEEIVPHHGTVMRLSPDGEKLEIYATGMRAPNGIGVHPDGRITAGDNEGTWVPRCKLHWLSEGSFQGVVAMAPDGTTPAAYNPPLCWFPMEVDNSSGGQIWVDSEQWGPMQGEFLHLSYGQSCLYRVLWEERDGVAQGGVVRLPVKLGSTAMRARFHPGDGQLYVCGLRGWQTNAARLTAFQRVRYTGTPLPGPKGLNVREDGVELRFEAPLDRELAEDPESWSVEQWDYVWGPQYGSPEVSAADPDPEVLEKAQQTEMKGYRKHDPVRVRRAILSEDGLSVRLELDGLQPVMQMKITADLETVEGDEVLFDLYNTIHWIAPPAGG